MRKINEANKMVARWKTLTGLFNFTEKLLLRMKAFNYIK